MRDVNTQIIDTIILGEIKKSKIHGHGLFSKKDLFKGEILLSSLDGQNISWKDLENSKIVTSEWNAISNSRLLLRPIYTKYGFINHSRDPNIEINNKNMSIFLLQDIKKGEEFFLDYRNEPLPKEYLEGHGGTYL